MPGPEGITCPEANGTVYTDAVLTDLRVDQFFIYCGFELVDQANTKRSPQLSFEACINDCNEDDDCDGVTWRPNGDDQRWCYHESKGAVLRASGMNFWSALKIYNDNSAVSFSTSIPLSIATRSFAIAPLPTTVP